MNYLVPIAFVAIIVSLAVALIFMLRPRNSDAAADEAARSRRMARALTFRVAFSIALFVLVLLAWALGWITPTGIKTGQ